ATAAITAAAPWAASPGSPEPAIRACQDAPALPSSRSAMVARPPTPPDTPPNRAAMLTARLPLTSALQRDGRVARSRLLALRVLGPDFEVDELLAVLFVLAGDGA